MQTFFYDVIFPVQRRKLKKRCSRALILKGKKTPTMREFDTVVVLLRAKHAREQ